MRAKRWMACILAAALITGTCAVPGEAAAPEKKSTIMEEAVEEEGTTPDEEVSPGEEPAENAEFTENGSGSEALEESGLISGQGTMGQETSEQEISTPGNETAAGAETETVIAEAEAEMEEAGRTEERTNSDVLTDLGERTLEMKDGTAEAIEAAGIRAEQPLTVWNEDMLTGDDVLENQAASGGDRIVLDTSFVNSRYDFGTTVNIPFTLYSEGNSYGMYYVIIYDSHQEQMSYVSEDFPDSAGTQKLTLSWKANHTPGMYYVRCYSTSTVSPLDDTLVPFYVNDDGSMHFVKTQDTYQNAVSGNLSSPLSAWKRTRAVYQPYPWYTKQSYTIQLEEMYIDDLAAAVVNDENPYNKVPGSDQRWLFIKFYLENNGSEKMDASDIINSSNFFTKSGAKITVSDTATLSGNRTGGYDLELYGGASGSFWIGILIPKSAGYPYIELNNGCTEDLKEVVCWVNTDPEAGDSSGNWPFSDVSIEPGNWRYEAVRYVYQYGIMNGISGTKNFAPDDMLTRAMFATIIYRMEGSPSTTYRNKFPDVPNGNYYSLPVLWANSVGIIQGHSNTGLFGTYENITREDMVTIMYRYCRYKGYNTSGADALSKFPDAVEISGYARSAMQWAVANGIINGRSNTGMLDPKGNATRVECAAIIQRFMQKYVE